MASAVGGITLLKWASGGFGGATLSGAAFSGLETGIIATGAAALNYAVVSLAWEVGVGIGSLINPLLMPCEEEPSPCQ